MIKRICAAALAALSLAACGGYNRQESEADKITRAVIANDMHPVMGDLAPSIKGEITRVQVAELSDELNSQGAYKGLKQTNEAWCDTRYDCFNVTFANSTYHEAMEMDRDGKVRYWYIKRAEPTPQPTH